MLPYRSWKMLAFPAVLLAAGCSSTGEMFPAAGNHPFKIESEPSGADVYVMGDKVGVTPIMISDGQVFPVTYPADKQSTYGRITLRKTGCADLTRTVSSEISSHGWQAKLDCGDLSSAPPAAAHGGETVEQRLDKVKDLLDKGLITEDEAKKARERILNDL